MQKIFEIVFRQFVTIYVGSTLLFIFYKIIGKDISYDDILNKKDETGFKKHTYISFIVGFIFILILILLTKKYFKN
jgi:uncharacterized membrane protein YdcZ (DUF606 family)